MPVPVSVSCSRSLFGVMLAPPVSFWSPSMLSPPGGCVDMSLAGLSSCSSYLLWCVWRGWGCVYKRIQIRGLSWVLRYLPPRYRPLVLVGVRYLPLPSCVVVTGIFRALDDCWRFRPVGPFLLGKSRVPLRLVLDHTIVEEVSIGKRQVGLISSRF